jgi:CHASE3 domain sensor protein
VSLWAPLKAARGIGQGARSTLTEKLARSFKLIFALILITLAITILAFSITATVIDPRIERHLAAGDAIERSHAGMLDQETGIRGFLLTGAPSFLGPYRGGLVQTDRQNRRLLLLLGDEGRLAELVSTGENRQTEWGQWAARALTRGLEEDRSLEFLGEGKVLFDR